ncbi:MAG: hypothetical protein KF730_11175 [Sphingomonas sp.]|uniref:hypothetical protein n=1 Tax=Sphingomonas sp. TaxID=28214 RepID=UPI0025FF123A|nr:hypothetical protein [Sphingomonas sp.]MBX3565122.1 hypothetical protein [Sphingomonas sp.]
MSPARAEWIQVKTDHFILTINDSEASARDFAVRLETFDYALRTIYGVSDTEDRLSRPIKVFALNNQLFAETCRCPFTLAYYSPRTQGSFILTQHLPKTDAKAKTGGWSSQTLLLHEYSHHFMYSNFPVAYPFWYSEGFAEFNANVSFETDGSLILGYPANYRADGIINGDVSIKQLIDPNQFGFPANMDALYGRGWLLTHYLMLAPQRKGQLAAYLAVMNKGLRSYAAAQQTFGDLNALNNELVAYRRGKLAAPLRIPPPPKPPAMILTKLSAGEAEILPLHLLFADGIDQRYRQGPAIRAARIAAKYPGDITVQEQYAAIEILAGRLDKADAAADLALQRNPASVVALTRKGQVAMQRLRDAKNVDPAAWTLARAWFLKANKGDPNAVMPLYYFYTSFVAAKAKPSTAAITALMRAAVLAPESKAVRLALARQMLLDRDAATARTLLEPIAFAPHRSKNRNIPREIIEAIDAGDVDKAIALATENDGKDDKDN